MEKITATTVYLPTSLRRKLEKYARKYFPNRTGGKGNLRAAVTDILEKGFEYVEERGDERSSDTEINPSLKQG